MPKLIIYDGVLVLRRLIEKENGSPFAIRQLYEEVCLKAKQGDIQIWCFEGVNNNKKRRDIYPEYKMNRKNISEIEVTVGNLTDSIKEFIKFWREILKHCPKNVFQVDVPEYEADDIIWNICKRYNNFPIEVETRDGDLRSLEQLPNVTVNMESMKDFPPELVHLYKASVGDRSDNIPGIKGLGKKTWQDLSVGWGYEELQSYFEKKGPPPEYLKDSIKEDMWVNRELYTRFYRVVKPIEVSNDVVEARTVCGDGNSTLVEALLRENFQ